MQVYKLLNIHEYHEKYNIPETKFVDMRVAYDGKIYVILIKEEEFTIKDRVNGWRKGYHRTFYFFRITFDWKNGEVIETEQFEFDNNNRWINYWCPIKENFLLVNARTDSRKKTPNAHIVDKDGNLIREFCIGDGVENCCTTPSGKIIVGYMDDGILFSRTFGAKHGYTMWDENGKKIWWSRKI